MKFAGLAAKSAAWNGLTGYSHVLPVRIWQSRTSSERSISCLFKHRFPHLIAFPAYRCIHACCSIIVSLFHALHHRFSRGFPPLSWFPLHAASLHCMAFSDVLFLTCIALGRWCLLSGVLWNQGMSGSEHWKRYWAHRSHILFSIMHHGILSIH